MAPYAWAILSAGLPLRILTSRDDRAQGSLTATSAVRSDIAPPASIGSGNRFGIGLHHYNRRRRGPRRRSRIYKDRIPHDQDSPPGRRDRCLCGHMVSMRVTYKSTRCRERWEVPLCVPPIRAPAIAFPPFAVPGKACPAAPPTRARMPSSKSRGWHWQARARLAQPLLTMARKTSVEIEHARLLHCRARVGDAGITEQGVLPIVRTTRAEEYVWIVSGLEPAVAV